MKFEENRIVQFFSILLQKFILPHTECFYKIKYMYVLYRINFFIVIPLKINLHVSQLLALQTLAMLLLQGHSQTSTDVWAHNFYNTLAS